MSILFREETFVRSVGVFRRRWGRRLYGEGDTCIAFWTTLFAVKNVEETGTVTKYQKMECLEGITRCAGRELSLVERLLESF
jgi:hypothetical protein